MRTRWPGRSSARWFRATRAIDYAGLDALMDRVAAALQRDGCQPGDAIAICAHGSPRYAAVFLGALRAGVAVAPLAPSVTAEQFASMLRDSAARLLFADDAAAPLLAGQAARTAHRSRWTPAWPPSRWTTGWRRRAAARPGDAAARVALQHHLFQRHHRHAQGHRAIARHALDARDARCRLRLRHRHGDAAVHAAVLEHHAGGVLPDACRTAARCT